MSYFLTNLLATIILFVSLDLDSNLVTPLNATEQAGASEDSADKSSVKQKLPQGEIKGPFQWKSNIFPGTVRDYWIYVPAQYDGKKPACVMVVQDGLGRAKGWRLTQVMDQLIHQKQMPVTIGIFLNPGVVPAIRANAQARYNRSFEYDAMGDRYARFLLEEILPEVEKKYKLSKDPNDRAIAGASSGAICALTVAWERPDAFRRVLSTIGTYVSLRGGNEYPALIRKTEPKPIRIFLQDGKTDLNLYGGSWWVANQEMLSALKFAGYDVKHAWGSGGHNSKHAAKIMPEAMKWLWRDHPKPIEAGKAPKRRMNLLLSGEKWQLVSKGYKFTEGPAVNSKGELFFTDVPNSRIHKVGLDGKVTVFADCPGANGLMFGSKGHLYACQSGDQKIVRFDPQGKKQIVVNDATSNDITVMPNGSLYYTDPKNKKIWYVRDGKKQVVDRGIGFANGVIPSADNSLLFVADTHGRFVYSYQIQSNGSLKYKQRFGHLHVPDDPANSGADGMTVDTMGRLYVTTRLGIQVLDQAGRVHFIIDKPQRAWLSNVVFGGKNFDTLYVTCGGKVYRRKINAKGVIPWQGNVKPPRPKL